MPILTLLTDYGTRDYYVAAVKGAVLSRAPTASIVDIAHEVAPGQVGEASFLLAAAVPNFPPGTVHLAIVDPGVGSARRLLCVESAGAILLAPDNGLLTPWLLGDAARIARAVTRPDLCAATPAPTFDGRDRFAPIAAALLNGEPPAALGPLIDDPVELPETTPERAGNTIVGRVVHVDRFGNLITNIPSRWLGPSAAGLALRVEVGDRAVDRWATHYAEIPESTPAALFGSLATVELSLRDDSLARHWRMGSGAEVRIAGAGQALAALALTGG